MPTQTSLTLSSNQVKPFLFEDQPVRTVMLGNEPWFVASDICHVLGISNVSQATSRLDPDEKGICLTDTPGGTQSLLAVNEPGLYSLVLRSDKPEAKRFKRWINHEVLPSIRKTGSYAVSVPAPAPAELTRMDILKLAMESEEARLKAEAERDHAIATKAQIGSRREASAMAAASHAKREVEKLKAALGESQKWATVRAVERAMHSTYPWLPLKKWCDAHEVEVRKVPDPLYGHVNSYPDGAWAGVYDINIAELFA